MEDWLWVAITTLLVSTLVVVFKEIQRKWFTQAEATNWPPGPRRVPIFGNLHQMMNGGGPAHVNLAKLAKEHGRMMTIRFGTAKPRIVISDVELAWEVLVTKTDADFSSRIRPYFIKIISANWQTISTSDLGPFWHKLRNGLQSTTLNPNNMSELSPTQEEDVFFLLSSLHKEASLNKGVVKPMLHIRKNTVKLTSRFCFGSQFKDDVFVDRIDSAVDEAIRLSGKSRLVGGFEFFQYMPGINGPFKELDSVRRCIQELFHPFLLNPEFSLTHCPNNCYLKFLLSQDLSQEIIIFNLFEMFVLSIDSVSSTVAWGLALLIHHQDVQEKLYDELSREIGNAEFKVEDVKSLKYLQAVVKEIMRVKPIAPLAIPHKADRDNTIMGTKIVAGTAVVVNLYKIMHDPNIWVDPLKFMPERFLDSSRITDQMERSFLPFSAGRRACPAKDLAKLQVAFTLASLVKKIHWSSAVENQLPDLSEELTVILMMKTPLEALISLRA